MRIAEFWSLRFYAWKDSKDYLHLVPMDWPGFNRYCWAYYGTGRTEPDEGGTAA